MIFRDDDISAITKLEQFRFVHEIFIFFGVTHTLAIIAKDIERNENLVRYINDHKKELDLQLHCYEHFDHSKSDSLMVTASLNFGRNKIEKVFGETPTIFFPPWNAVNPDLYISCKILGLECKPEKISLDQYIRKNGDVSEDVINFHYWHEPEVNDLYRALKIYTSK